MTPAKGENRKPLHWAGRTREDLATFPRRVKLKFGFALHEAQVGRKHPDAKPLKGFQGSGVLEIVADDACTTYRGVYTVRFEARIYVLHVFQKKSRHGRSTPRREIDLVKSRLEWAERDYEGSLEKKN